MAQPFAKDEKHDADAAGVAQAPPAAAATATDASREEDATAVASRAGLERSEPPRRTEAEIIVSKVKSSAKVVASVFFSRVTAKR